MPHYICITCGTQYPETDAPPEHCLICEDERQYVNLNGQQWTTLDALRAEHRVILTKQEPNLSGVGAEPRIAIGQRALLAQSPAGNVLWDCIPLLDDVTVDVIKAMGGISAIAISHPHFYTAMIEWSRAFDAPIYLHEANRRYVMRPDEAIVFWDGETRPLQDGITLIRCGGHFEGSTVLHWAAGADGRGALFTGDTITVVEDRRYVTFMYSYPNLIPLSASKVRRIAGAVEPYAFDRIYGGWLDKVIATDARAAVQRSAERYIRMISD